ncbi:type II toxin-antitoxin system HicB family antitoxin [soil metagenome]
MMVNRYGIVIFWSDQDRVFIADVPELPGCMAHGATHGAALKNVQKAMKLWIKSSREFGDEVPEPKGRRLMLA